jgi:exonuclease SbcC
VADQQRERVAASEAKLASLGFAVPTTLAEAEKLAARLGGRPIDELRGERDAVRERLAQACALAGEIERIIARLEGEIAAHDEVALSEQEAAWRRRLDKARRITAAWALKAAEIADRLGVAPDTNAVVGLVGRWQGEEQALHRRIAERDDLRRQEAERRKNIDSLRKALAERTSSLQSLAPGLTIDDLASVEQALQACYRELGGDEVSSQLRDIETKIARKQGDLTARGRAIERLIETARGIVAQVNVAEALSSSPTLAEVERLLARLDRLDLGDEETLLEQRERLLGQVGFLRNSKANLERELGLSGNELDIELCRREHEAKVHEHAVREKAVQIVATARRRVVEKVLPSTMEHMRALLPILTLDRYHDAELTEDYKIRVWDERAGDHGAWKEKNIFSGGTKDQFSLALRLAFALATLPAERGTAPSFIFLDEPLGSFDDERAQALLDLLTEGAIARSFDQIFLISHVRVDPSLFTNRITLDAGRVVESDLPDPTLSPLKRGG